MQWRACTEFGETCVCRPLRFGRTCHKTLDKNVRQWHGETAQSKEFLLKTAVRQQSVCCNSPPLRKPGAAYLEAQVSEYVLRPRGDALCEGNAVVLVELVFNFLVAEWKTLPSNFVERLVSPS